MCIRDRLSAFGDDPRVVAGDGGPVQGVDRAAAVVRLAREGGTSRAREHGDRDQGGGIRRVDTVGIAFEEEQRRVQTVPGAAVRPARCRPGLTGLEVGFQCAEFDACGGAEIRQCRLRR